MPSFTKMVEDDLKKAIAELETLETARAARRLQRAKNALAKLEKEAASRQEDMGVVTDMLDEASLRVVADQKKGG